MPMMPDDQHGTTVVALAGLTNVAPVVGRELVTLDVDTGAIFLGESAIDNLNETPPDSGDVALSPRHREFDTWCSRAERTQHRPDNLHCTDRHGKNGDAETGRHQADDNRSLGSFLDDIRPETRCEARLKHDCEHCPTRSCWMCHKGLRCEQ